MPYAAILNSRQSKTPVGGDPWVAATLAAVRDAADRGYIIISSIGLNTWELVTWAAGDRGCQVVVYIPYPYDKNIYLDSHGSNQASASASGILLHEFNLEPSQISFYFQEPSPQSGTKKSFWPRRDREITELADILYPISIRPEGNLAQMITKTGAGKQIRREFQVTYQKSRRPVILKPAVGHVRPSFPDALDGYITHWTRAAHGRWPGETAAEYYRDIARSGREYPRTAYATLRRILTEQRLRASNRHIRGGFPVVSFTSLKPQEAVKLMRWRKRYVRWSFEPYGLAIKKEVAEAHGIRPVIYGTPADYRLLDEVDRPFFQNVGQRGGDWAPEKEWRHLGDFDLRGVSPDALKIIVRSAAEIPMLRLYPESQKFVLFD